MQWTLGLLTKARLTQRSLFKSIYSILKVIFSLNKHLRGMTLFSLLVFFQMEKHPILQDPRLELCIRSCCLWASGAGVPQEGNWGQEQPVPGRTGFVRWQNQGASGGGVCQTQAGRQNRVTTSHAISHTPLWEPCFLMCPISYVSTLPRFAVWFNYTQTDPERKLWVFSDDGYVFTVLKNRWVWGARFPAWPTVLQLATRAGRSWNR